MSDHDLDWLAAQQPQRMGLDGGARERALLKLVQHTTARPGRRSRRLPSLFHSRVFGLSTAVGTAALAAAVVLSTAGGGSAGGRAGSLAPSKPQLQAAVHHHGARSPLLRLADYVSTSTTPPGDATLVARTTATGGQTVTVYDLYADNGQYFFSRDESGLQAQVDAHHNLAGGLFAREIAAAKEAATGNVQQAGMDMAKAPDPNSKIDPNQPADWGAAAAKLRLLAAHGDKQAAAQLAAGAGATGTLYDNWAWEDSQDALIAGSGDPQVRAGVLKILATLPGVTVTQGTFGGQPALVLTAGSQEVGAGYSEQLTINADTGVPIHFVGGPPSGTPATTVDYRVSRVTLANLPSGAAGSGD
jgi:hypothetical protein